MEQSNGAEANGVAVWLRFCEEGNSVRASFVSCSWFCSPELSHRGATSCQSRKLSRVWLIAFSDYYDGAQLQTSCGSRRFVRCNVCGVADLICSLCRACDVDDKAGCYDGQACECCSFHWSSPHQKCVAPGSTREGGERFKRKFHFREMVLVCERCLNSQRARTSGVGTKQK